MDIQDKVALVTGGASGIGLACVEELLKQGARGVTIVAISDSGSTVADDLNKTFAKDAGNKVLFVKADVSDITSLEGAFKETVYQFKNLDIVINNAGTVDEFNFQRLYNVNLIGVANGIQLAMENYLPKYKSTSDAVIVNTSSIAALVPWNSIPHYAATKFAIIGLTLNFGSKFHRERTGVRVAAVCPGLTNTNLPSDSLKLIVHCEQFLQQVQCSETQEPKDVAEAYIHAIKEGKSGALYTIIGGKLTEVDYPGFSS